MAEASSSLTERISDWLIRRRHLLFSAALLLTAAALWPSTHLVMDTSVTNLFSPNDPVLLAYRESVEAFEGAELVVIAYTDPDLLTPQGLSRVHVLAQQCRELPDVQQVLSLADLPWPPALPDMRALHLQVQHGTLPAGYLRSTLLESELFKNLFVSESEQGLTTAIWLTLRTKKDDPGYADLTFWKRLTDRDRPKSADERRKAVIADIRRIAASNPLPTVVAGGPILTHDATMYVDKDSFTLGWVSTLALTLVIGVLFRKLRWVLLPLVVVHVTLIWTKAVLWLFAAHLTMVSTTLTALVTVIGVAGVVQVTARYREEREGAELGAALRRTMFAAGPAVWWASLTTAAGFASLLITSIVPVRTFAFTMALASMLVFVTTAALVPAVVLFGRRPSDPGAAPGERGVERLLEVTMDWSLARPGQVGLAAIALLALTVAGIFRIRSETDFTRNFRRSSQVVVATNFVEQRLGGVGAIALEFEVPEELTPEWVGRLRRLETELRTDSRLTKVLGIVDALEIFEAGVTGVGIRVASRLVSEETILEGKLALLNSFRPELVRTFWRKEKRQMRIMLRAREQEPSAVKIAIITGVEQTGHQILDEPGAPANLRVTGTYTLLTHLVSGLMADQVKTFLLAAAAVFSIMTIALRSIRLAVVGLVPKLGPILMVLGAMGWFDVPIDMGTPMIASVSIGLSVGFSIHYLYRFRQERAAGVPFDQALRATHRRVGGAMVFSNLAIVVGFAVLTLSNFIPTVHFSILADVALVGGLAGNLLVLPLLLKWIAG